MGGHLHLPGVPQLPPQVAIAAPINDMQLAAIIAGQLLSFTGAPGVVTSTRDTGVALELAYNLIAGSIVKYRAHRLDYYVAQHEAAMRADGGADQ